MALLAGGAACLILLADLWRHVRRPAKSSLKLSSLLIMTFLAGVIFVASLTPLILFDLKHEGINATAFTKLFTKEEAFVARNETVFTSALRALRETHGRSMLILFEVMVGQHLWIHTGLVVVTLATLAKLFRDKKNKYRVGLGILLAYLIVGILGTAAYGHSVFHHYILFLVPVTAWLYGVMFTAWWPRWYGKAALLTFMAFFAWYNITHYPFKPIGWRVADIDRTAATVYERVRPGEKYNVVLMSGTGDIDAQNYRYFLEATDQPPVPTSQRGEVSTLFIINEDRKLAKVVDSPIYEIVVFPNKQPAEVYTVPGGPEITVLRVLPSEPTQ
jgi:hypothetical protein